MKKLLYTAALTSVLALSSCVGQYNAFRGIQSWNTRATDSKVWNSVINTGFWIVPIYPIALIGDFWVFNTIEFWSGENPLNAPAAPTSVAENEG